MNVRKAAACVLAGTTASLTIFVAPHAAAQGPETSPTMTSSATSHPSVTASQTTQPSPSPSPTVSITRTPSTTAAAGTGGPAPAQPSPSATATVARTTMPASPVPSATPVRTAALPTFPVPPEIGKAMQLTVQTGSDEARTAVQGKPFRLEPTVAGGHGPYYWYSYRGEHPEKPKAGDPIEGRMPEGLALDEATGAISGTPTRAGIYAFDLIVGEGGEDGNEESVRLGAAIVVIQVLPANADPKTTPSAVPTSVAAPAASATTSTKATATFKAAAKAPAKVAKAAASKAAVKHVDTPAAVKHVGTPGAAAPKATQQQKGLRLAATGADDGALAGLAAAGMAVVAGAVLLRRRKNG